VNEPDERLGSRYVLEARVGRGAMGAVWRARNTDTGETVAVKLLADGLAEDRDLLARFVQERSAMMAVDHPNVVRVHDMVVERDRLALVMDFVPGPDLHGYLQEQGPLRPALVAALGVGIAGALEAIHRSGIVHRDLKPANVLLDTTGPQPLPRLVDFGVARIVSTARLTAHQSLVGTPQYLSPELIGGAEPGPPCDIYAFGITLYELLTGYPPFHGGQLLDILQRQLHEEPEWPETMPGPLTSVLRSMLTKDPGERASAAEVGAALAALALELEGLPAAEPTGAEPAEPPAYQPPYSFYGAPAAPALSGSGDVTQQPQAGQVAEAGYVPQMAASSDVGFGTPVDPSPSFETVRTSSPSLPPGNGGQPALAAQGADRRAPVRRTRQALVILAAAIALTAGVGLYIASDKSTPSGDAAGGQSSQLLDTSSAGAVSPSKNSSSSAAAADAPGPTGAPSSQSDTSASIAPGKAAGGATSGSGGSKGGTPSSPTAAVSNAGCDGPGLVGGWTLAGSGSACAGGLGLSVSGGFSWTTDPSHGTVLSLNGSSGYAQSAGTVVDTGSSYSVAAWVELSQVPSNSATAVSEFGSVNSPFYLQYNAGNHCWAFVISSNDSRSAVLNGPGGPSGVTAGVWYHIVGVYNADSNSAQIYVNGHLEASASDLTSWSTSGALNVGRDLYAGYQVDYFPGQISGVEVFDEALSSAEVASL
jgi:serine/threonine protein kinase